VFQCQKLLSENPMLSIENGCGARSESPRKATLTGLKLFVMQCGVQFSTYRMRGAMASLWPRSKQLPKSSRSSRKTMALRSLVSQAHTTQIELRKTLTSSTTNGCKESPDTQRRLAVLKTPYEVCRCPILRTPRIRGQQSTRRQLRLRDRQQRRQQDIR